MKVALIPSAEILKRAKGLPVKLGKVTLAEVTAAAIKQQCDSMCLIILEFADAEEPLYSTSEWDVALICFTRGSCYSFSDSRNTARSIGR